MSIKFLRKAHPILRCPRRSIAVRFLARLGIGDLVDQKANAAFGDDVRCTIADLDGDDRVRGSDAEHGEEVHNRVCAPTDHRHLLSELDLPLDLRVALTLPMYSAL